MRQEPISPSWVLRLEAPGSVAAGLDPAQSPLFAPASPSGAEPGVLELARGSGRLPLSRAAELCAIANASGAPLHFADSGDGVLEADAETRALLDSLMRHALAVDDMPDARETPPLGARKAPGAQAEPIPKAPEPGPRRWALGKTKRQAEPPHGLLEESAFPGSAVIAFRAFSISLWHACGLSGPAASGEALRLVERAWAKLRVR